MFRSTGYIDDGACGFQCLDCKERFSVCSCVDNWKACPCCGAKWEEKPSRLPSVPRWVFDRWGNGPHYGLQRYPRALVKEMTIEAEYKIVGHDEWRNEFTLSVSLFADRERTMHTYRYAIEQFDCLGSEMPFPIEYRLKAAGKVISFKATTPKELEL